MPIDVSEESILEALHRIPQEHWAHVLDFLHHLGPSASQPPEKQEPNRWTIAELLALPPEKRDAILEAQAALAEHDYRNDKELTAFEAFGPDYQANTRHKPVYETRTQVYNCGQSRG